MTPGSGAQEPADPGRAIQPFPWPRAIGLGLGVLRLSPDAFWRMTPRELAFALRVLLPANSPLGRAEFAELAARFPDTPSAKSE
jgi:uncharacterized phage protein (TIGR02216 family)